MHQNEALAKHQAEEMGKVQREEKRLPPIFKVAFPAPHPLDKTRK